MSSDAPTEIGKRDCERTPECENTEARNSRRCLNIHQRGSILSGEYIIWMFHLLEAFAFILPALPADIRVRLFILCIYWVGHYFHLQTAYVKLKREYIKVK
jgi:hypothetical protein